MVCLRLPRVRRRVECAPGILLTGQPPMPCHTVRNEVRAMKYKLMQLSKRYTTSLRRHLKQGPRASLQPARRLGYQAARLELETLDVARIHQEALATLEASSARDGIVRRAEIFFAEAVTPIEK